MRFKAPYVRKHQSGTVRIKRDTYNTNQYGMEQKSQWYRTADRIRKRDNNTCIWCKSPATEVHHIVPLSRGGLTTDSNLACICTRCHDKRHSHLHAKRSKPTFIEPF